MMKIAVLKLSFKIIKIYSLITEVYKITKGQAQAVNKNLFIFWKNIHNIRMFQIITNENKNSVRYQVQTLCYRTPYLWARLPEE